MVIRGKERESWRERKEVGDKEKEVGDKEKL
jgi:hypothetical protein